MSNCLLEFNICPFLVSWILSATSFLVFLITVSLYWQYTSGNMMSAMIEFCTVIASICGMWYMWSCVVHRCFCWWYLWKLTENAKPIPKLFTYWVDGHIYYFQYLIGPQCYEILKFKLERFSSWFWCMGSYDFLHMESNAYEKYESCVICYS